MLAAGGGGHRPARRGKGARRGSRRGLMVRQPQQPIGAGQLPTSAPDPDAAGRDAAVADYIN